MYLEEKTIKREHIYDGKIISVRVENVQLPDGSFSNREIVDHKGGVGIIAVTPEKKILMVRQYRKPMEKEIVEIPAGKLEVGEEPLECARRELKEETGYESEDMELINEFYTAPGFCNEKVYIYHAKDLVYTGAELDQGEFLNLEEYNLEDIDTLINSVEDAKTIIALYYLKSKLGE